MIEVQWKEFQIRNLFSLIPTTAITIYITAQWDGMSAKLGFKIWTTFICLNIWHFQTSLKYGWAPIFCIAKFAKGVLCWRLVSGEACKGKTNKRTGRGAQHTTHTLYPSKICLPYLPVTNNPPYLTSQSHHPKWLSLNSYPRWNSTLFAQRMKKKQDLQIWC